MTNITVYDYLKKDTKILSNALKLKILQSDLFKYQCVFCGIDFWNNKPIVLQLDHINGDIFDNRLENLRLLCANCHSQTDSFRSSKNSNVRNCPGCNKKLNRGTLQCQTCYYNSFPKKPLQNRKRIFSTNNHSKTTTFCVDCDVIITSTASRCKKCTGHFLNPPKINYPSLDIILETLKNMSFRQYSKILGISDNGLRNHLKRNNINPKTLEKLHV